jgi:hypothetical protein
MKRSRINTNRGEYFIDAASELDLTKEDQLTEEVISSVDTWAKPKIFQKLFKKKRRTLWVLWQ